MSEKCGEFYKCELATKYRAGLEGADKKELAFFLTTCSNKRESNDCEIKQRNIDNIE